MNLFSSEDLFFSFSSHFPLLSDSFRASGAEGKEKNVDGGFERQTSVVSEGLCNQPR